MRAAPAGVNSAGKKGCEATESDYGPRFQFTAGLRRLARILLTSPGFLATMRHEMTQKLRRFRHARSPKAQTAPQKVMKKTKQGKELFVASVTFCKRSDGWFPGDLGFGQFLPDGSLSCHLVLFCGKNSGRFPLDVLQERRFSSFL
jgi:hypothetical protein